jgi:anti-anti-sigma regulatory factor
MLIGSRLFDEADFMELSIEVKRWKHATVLTCRGMIVQGQASDYLFDLVTRPDRRDVVLDMQSVTKVDEAGIFVIVLCYELLTASKRRLFLRNASPEILDGLRRQQTDKANNAAASGSKAALKLQYRNVQ